MTPKETFAWTATVAILTGAGTIGTYAMEHAPHRKQVTECWQGRPGPCTDTGSPRHRRHFERPPRQA